MKPKIEWWRLKHGRCPKCRGPLDSPDATEVKILLCPNTKCQFKIANNKANKILSNLAARENSKGFERRK